MAGDIPQLVPSRREKARPIIPGMGSGRLLVAGLLSGFGLYLEGWIGLLLLVAGTDLAMSRRPFAPRPACWPALCVTAAGILLVDPAAAFACGWLVEISCDPALAGVPTFGGGEPGKEHE